jgi:hypothetical protein
MMQLPGVTTATLDDAKIIQYLLNPDHSIGAAKEKFFAAHGFSLAHRGALKEALLAHPRNNPVSGQFTNRYGTKYEVRCSLRTPDGRDPCIVSV